MSSYAVERNLPIFKKNRVIKQASVCRNITQDERFYIQGKIDSDTFLGVMNSTPRKDYYAYIDSYKGKEGIFRIGKLEYTKVNKLKLIEGDSILIEVIPNKIGSIIFFSEYVPSYSGSNLKFTNEDVRMTFFEWLKFISNNE
jgi:hypothetical protein